MNGRTKGGRERKNGWKGNIAIVDEREVDVWLPSMPVSLACPSSMSDRRSGVIPPFLPSVVRLHRIGSNEEAAVTLKRTIRGPYLSGRPLEGGTKDGRARAKSCPPSCRILLFFERVIVVTPEQEDNLCISYSYASEWSYPPRRGTMEARTRGENWQSFPDVTQFASCVLHSVWA